MAASLTTLDAVMKQFYLGPLQEELNTEIMAFELFRKTKVDWVGKQAIIPTRVGRNTAVGFSATALLPAPAGQQTYAALTVEAKYLYGRMGIEGPAIAQAKASVGAFVNGLQIELDGAMETVKNSANQAMFTGGGCAGFLNERKVGAPAAAFEYTGNIELIPEGLVGVAIPCIVVRLDTYGQQVAACAVFRDPGDTSHVKFDIAVNTTNVDGTGVAVAGTAHAVILTGAPFLAEANGVYNNIANPNHFLINRSDTGAVVPANTELQGIVRAANDATAGTGTRIDLATGRMQAMLDEVATESGSTPDCMISHYIFRQQYVGQLSFTSTAAMDTSRTKSVDGGDPGFDMDRLAFNGIPLKVSRHCGKGILIFIHTKAWTLVQIDDPNLADLDGNVLSRVAGSDAYEAYVRYYYNLVCKQPNRNAILVGINFAGQ